MISSQRIVTTTEMSSSYFDKGRFEQLLKDRLFEPIIEHIYRIAEISCTEELGVGLKYKTSIVVCNPKELRGIINYIISTLTDDQIIQIRREAGRDV